MKPVQFDPFSSRLARDIRNNLSKSFIRALAQKDASIFQQSASAFRKQHLDPVYDRYIAARLEKYEKAYGLIDNNKQGDALQQAATLWDLELYFEMHEILEPEWQQAEGERRRALQGLIRAAGMKILIANNRGKGAARMGVKALADLQRYGKELNGFSNREAVLTEIRQTLGVSKTGGSVD